jgi:hypothetical protein
VWEGQGSAGVGVAVVDGAAGIDVGLAAGAVVQRFDLASPWATDRTGTSATPGVWAPVYVRWATGHLVFTARAAVGLARSPTHGSEGATLWSRGSLRFETVLAVGWAF